MRNTHKKKLSKRKYLIAAVLVCISGACFADSIEEGEAYVTSSGKKIVHYEDGRLVFYDGIKDDSNAVNEFNCKGKTVIASHHGIYIAIGPGGITKTVNIRIFNDSGKLSGDFTNNESYNLRSISDTGPLMALGYDDRDISEIYPKRFCDAQGTILYDLKNSPGGIIFARDGTPIAYEGDNITGQIKSLLLLDLKGKVITKHNINPVYLVDNFNAAKADGPVCVMLVPEKEIYADKFLVWLPVSGIVREINIKDEKLGFGQRNFSISPNGDYVAIMMGRKGLLVYNVVKDSIVYKKGFNVTVEGQEIDHFLDIAIDNNAKVLATGSYYAYPDKKKIVTTCSLLDRTGNVLNSTIINRAFTERPKIQILSDGSFAVSAGSGDKVIVMK